MRPVAIAALVLAGGAPAGDGGQGVPDAGSCCARCGGSHPLCLHCPRQFEECSHTPHAPDCRRLEGLELCECLTSAGQGTCDVVDGAVRLTYNATFCAYAADYGPSEYLNACTYEQRDR